MKVNNQDVSLVTDAHTLISTHDIAVLGASASIDITSGIDSTYDAYEFRFTNMHPATDNVSFQFQVNAAGATGFNETITSNVFRGVQNEGDTSGALGYYDIDQAQGSAYQNLTSSVGGDTDQQCSGVLTLYAPSSTTYVKHFTATTHSANPDDFTQNIYAAGYINDTTAIDEISFKFTSGNIDAGVIKMYGIAKA
eukprot:GHVO01030067.1.p2 GENE.GHVO01030067.1~~GHVO01030067.1.p2  ORF type:complete len:195 (+),score=17.29 GHVO01030067.1:1406-1990(+)